VIAHNGYSTAQEANLWCAELADRKNAKVLQQRQRPRVGFATSGEQRVHLRSNSYSIRAFNQVSIFTNEKRSRSCVRTVRCKNDP